MEKKKKVNLIVILSVALVLTIGIGVTIFLLNYNFGDMPSLQVVRDSGKFYLLASPNENYQGYRFTFESDKESFFIDTKQNFLDVASVQVEYGTEYKISTCYLGENEGGNSSFSSPISWTASRYLNSPQIRIEDNMLKWNKIDGASEYHVYLNGKKNVSLSEQYSLANIEGGQYSIFVVAFSKEDYLFASGESNVIETQIIHQFKPLTKVSVNSETYTLTAVGSEKLSYIDVTIGTKTYKCKVESAQGYTYQIDISPIYKPGVKISAAPSQIDDYNIYLLEPTYAE